MDTGASVVSGQTDSVGDPLEGLDENGVIRTGASIARVSEPFRRILDTTVDAIRREEPAASVYAYGSVTTGQATSPTCDVDILTIGLDAPAAQEIAADMSTTFGVLCRSVEIAAASASEFVGDTDEVYGGRVFLHHYCVHLAGPDLDRATAGFPGDRRAARAFNGDIARHHARWSEDSGAGGDAVELGRRISRKTLLAVAGLVSVHDSTWTTDRRGAACRWSDVHPRLRIGLEELAALADGTERAVPDAVDRAIDGVVALIVEQFAAEVGLWTESTI